MECLKNFNTKADILMEKLRLKADGTTQIDLLNEMSHVTLDVIASVSFFCKILSWITIRKK